MQALGFVIRTGDSYLALSHLNPKLNAIRGDP
jgi:hypothetical protein